MAQNTLRCSLRFFDRGMPVTVGYPLAKLTTADRTLIVSCHRAAGRFAVRLDAVRRAERTPHGVRVYVGDDHRFVVGHLRVSRLAEFLRRAGLEIDEAVTPATWTDV